MKDLSLKEKIICLAGAFLVSLLLFLLLPVSYFFFHGDLQKALLEGRKKTVALDTVSLQKKREPEKKTVNRKQVRQSHTRNMASNHFNLNLDVLSEGEGEGLVNPERGRVIEDYEADIAPVKKFTLPPRYPDRARSAGITGTVVARILINERGEVEAVRILKAPGGWGFEEAVKEALVRWRFEPASLKEMPVRVWARQEVHFSQ